MDNYYEECITKVEGLIQSKEFEEAKSILEDELDMPYVPEVHLKKFLELYHSLPQENVTSSKYLDSIEEIESSLFLDEEQQLRAMLSLERLNLRPYLSILREWLISLEVDTWIKQQILVFLLEQGIEDEFQVYLEDEVQVVNTKGLSHPFQNEHYLKQVYDLKEKLEQENPSLFKLCMQELNYQVGNNFPFKHETIKAQDIMDRVDGYLNM